LGSLSEWAVTREASRLAGVPVECVDSDACLYGGLLYSIDGYSASESRLPWMSLGDWGWKAVVAASADVVASGGVPYAALYSIGAPRGEDVVEVAGGVGEAARWLGLVVLGGDTNRCSSGDLWIDVAVVGSPRTWTPWSRARRGFSVVQVGYVGYGFIASLLLRRKLGLDEVPEVVVDYTRRPKPPLRGLPDLMASCGVKAAVDNSDGWARSLWLVAKSSSVGVELRDVLVDPVVEELLKEYRLSLEGVLDSAEDYNIALFAPPESVDCILAGCDKLGHPCEVVGWVTSEASVVRFKGRRVEARGWDSFKLSS